MEEISRLTLVIISALLFAGCDGVGLPSPDVEEVRHERLFKNFRITDTEGERVLWEMSGERAVLSDDDAEQIFADKVEARFFDEAEEETLLNADSAELKRNTGEMRAWGNVRIFAGERKIYTSDVSWNPDEEVFQTDEDVTIIAPTGVVSGTGMVASRDLEDLTILRNIQGTFSER